MTKSNGGFCHCPHCGKRLNYFYTWSIKSKGEYLCKSCGQCSDVKLKSPLAVLGWSSVVLAALILLLFIVTGSVFVWMLPLMLVPFLIFTLISPLFVKLQPIGSAEKSTAKSKFVLDGQRK